MMLYILPIDAGSLALIVFDLIQQKNPVDFSRRAPQKERVPFADFEAPITCGSGVSLESGDSMNLLRDSVFAWSIVSISPLDLSYDRLLYQRLKTED